ncbi:MAG: signal peptidase I [Planctomycetaceae bacterium]|nr:signal peptidase I [Planctomycetaceae bacterium]
MAKKPPAKANRPAPDDVAPHRAKTAGGKAPGSAKKKAPAWRAGMDFIVMLGGALVVALLIKAYAFDVYLIPSGSMETALHGRPDGGDRIFCSKLSYRFRDLKRWEVAVFEFPYETARRNDSGGYESFEHYRGQNFVKRIVGLPGESLAIARGDIWVRPDGAREAHQRLVKPDHVQRGMWLHVYEEDFADISLDELQTFWKIGGGTVRLARGGPLVLDAGGQDVRLDYRARIPAGDRRDTLAELPGIPDRYTLEQPVQFRCAHVDADGAACGHVFVKTLRTQNMQARCPRCGTLADETAAVFYHRRSGLTAIGRYGVDPRNAPQGENVSARQADYHLVPDLRVTTDVTLASETASFTVALREDSRFVQATLYGNGQVEISVNGEPAPVDRRALAMIRPGVAHAVEFYMVDGTARLFVDSQQPLLDVPVYDDRRPSSPRNVPRSSGVSIGASGGVATLANLKIDRDVFYYSGWEQERGEKFAMMNSNGEIIIGRDSFFPMGDHCPSSYDARSWGPVPMSLLRGPALLVWWPPDRAGVIPAP